MKKTLVVSFTPRVESNTKKLLNTFLKHAEGKTEITHLDLTKEVPDLMQDESLNAYVKRNLKNEEVNQKELQSLTLMDRYTKMVSETDYLVLAYPIYNYFLPGLVKLWIDNITQAGVAFESTEFGPRGLWSEKEGLVINTSGSTPFESARDFSTPYIKYIFNYWGFRNTSVHGLFAVRYAGLLEEKLKEFDENMKSVSENWYSS